MIFKQNHVFMYNSATSSVILSLGLFDSNRRDYELFVYLIHNLPLLTKIIKQMDWLLIKIENQLLNLKLWQKAKFSFSFVTRLPGPAVTVVAAAGNDSLHRFLICFCHIWLNTLKMNSVPTSDQYYAEFSQVIVSFVRKSASLVVYFFCSYVFICMFSG